MQCLFCSNCGTQSRPGANFCGACGSLIGKPPGQTPPPASTTARHSQYTVKPNETNPCVPLLKNGTHGHFWADTRHPSQLFADSGKASYRMGEVKTRNISLSYLGNFVIIKAGRSENSGSASENIVNLRGIERTGADVKLLFKSHHWVYTASNPSKALELVQACVTLGMMLYQGPPAFPVTDGAQKVDLAAVHLFVHPTDDWILSNNLPTGWELCYADGPNNIATPYYLDHKTQTSHWSLPPDIQELVSVEKLKKYPKYLSDQGFFMSMRLWCAWLWWTWDQTADGPTLGEGHETPGHLLTIPETLKVVQGMQLPYWRDRFSPPSSDGKDLKVIDVQAIVENLVVHHKGADINVLLERALVPAICRAFSLNKFFSGIAFNARDTSDPELRQRLASMWHRRGEGELHSMLRGMLPRFTQLSLQSTLATTALTAVVPGYIRVRVHSMRHLPKMDTFGSCDGYVSVSVSAGGQVIGEMQKSEMVKGSYDPDFLDKNFGGQVRSLFWSYPQGKALSELAFEIKAMDWERMRKDDFIGNVKFAPMKVGEMEREGWFDVVDGKSGKDIMGKDKQKCQVYMRVSRVDNVNAVHNMKLPAGGKVQGMLTKLDLTCQLLPPAALDFLLAHAGVLRELRVGGCCHQHNMGAGQAVHNTTMAESKCADVILRHILDNIRKPGSGVPDTWSHGTQFLTDKAKALQPGRTVVVQSRTTSVLPAGFEQKLDHASGRQYYINHTNQQTQWDAPPGKTTVFGCVVSVSGDGTSLVDVGTGAPEECPSAMLGVIDPAFKGWGNSIQVLDVSLLPWSSSWALPAAVMSMPSLTELYMARVNPVGVLEALAHAAQARTWVPALRVLDISQQLEASHPAHAAVGESYSTKEKLDLGSMPAALAALQGSLKDLRMRGLIDLARDPMATLLQVLDSASGSLSDSTIDLSFLANDFVQPVEGLVAHTKFTGTIGLVGAKKEIIAAVCKGLVHNTSIKGLHIFGEWTAQGHSTHIAWTPTVYSALTQLLVHNATIKTLSLAGPTPESVFAAGPPAEDAASALQILTVGLAQNRGLTSLDTEGTCLGNAGMTAMGQALRQNRTLLALKLDRNACALEGWKAFRGCLYGNKKLHDCPLPEVDLHALIQGLESTVKRCEQAVWHAKAQIKVACRGGRVKPHLGNPALKQRSLEELRAAKREQGAAQRLKAKIEEEVPKIWAEIDKNSARFQEKYGAKLARAEEKRAAEERRRLQQDAKLQCRVENKFERWGQQNQSKWQRHNTRRSDYNRRHDDHDDHYYYGGYGYGAYGYGGGYYGHHNHHNNYYDDDDEWRDEQDRMMDADMEVADLQEQTAFEEEAAAEAAAAAEEAAAEEEANDLADVEAYAGAGPRDLPSAGDAGRGSMVVSGAAAAGETAAARARRLVREWGAAHDKDLEGVRGAQVLAFETRPAFLGGGSEPGGVGGSEGERGGRGKGGEVTLVTQASVDRLRALETQALAWRGPVSAAVFVRRGEAEEEEEEERESVRLVAELHERLAAAGCGEVCLSLLFANPRSECEYDNQYPINALRNLALNNATTPLVFLVDVDFVPSASLAELCAGAGSTRDVLRLASEEGKALVVPAFEVHAGPGTQAPTDVAALRELWERREAEGFHVSGFPRGHTPTDYARWWAAAEPYAVPYAMHFEPYVIMARERVPAYDERFRGYGMNKISHLLHVAAAGTCFVVLPRVFVSALEHTRSGAWQHAFGARRDPSHAVRIAYLMGVFRRDLAARYGAEALRGLLCQDDATSPDTTQHAAASDTAPAPALAAAAAAAAAGAGRQEEGGASVKGPKHGASRGLRRHGSGARPASMQRVPRRAARLVAQAQAGQHGSKLAVKLLLPAPPLRVVVRGKSASSSSSPRGGAAGEAHARLSEHTAVAAS